MNAAHQPLDPAQIVRINSTHRGFLFQHLVAVGALLLSGKSGLKKLTPERDEDVELEFSDHTTYTQSKYRSDLLQPGDVADSLRRFGQLRTEHASGRRAGNAEFVIFSNAAPSPSLSEQMMDWPDDVHLISPTIETSFSDLPPAWSGLETALDWCRRQCADLAFGSLHPETLVWKLAGMIQAACTGEGHITFHADDLPRILELIVSQVNRFPAPPLRYRPQEEEPTFPSTASNRLITGISGAGKTAWAANGSMHSEAEVAYIDALDVPSSSMPPILVRELAAAFYGEKRDDIRSLLLPGPSGLQSLRALEILLSRDHKTPIVVVDNVHRIDPAQLAPISQAVPSVRWIFLAHPWPGQAELETRLGIHAEQMNGWNTETVGQVFAEAGCPADLPVSQRLLELTGGLPLFVDAAARLCKRVYRSNPHRLAEALESHSVPQQTGQEIIINEILQNLSANALQAAALLSVCTVPLESDEMLRILASALGADRTAASSVIKEMVNWGILQFLQDGSLEMHDAFRLVANAPGRTIDQDSRQRFLQALASEFKPSPKRPVPLSRFRAYLTLLPEIGELNTLADLASNDTEFFVEQGMVAELRSSLLLACDDITLPPSEKFWALDTVVFWAIQEHSRIEANKYLTQMMELVTQFEPTNRQNSTLLMKQMMLAGLTKDLKTATDLFGRAVSLKVGAEYTRIVKYNYATILLACGKYEEVDKITFDLLMEYHDDLGLDVLTDVFRKSPSEIAAKIGDVTSKAIELKHLADVLYVRAEALDKLDTNPVLCRITSFKFYVLAEALVSVVKVGQEIIAEFLRKGFLSDAKQFMETALIPWVQFHKLLEYKLPIMSQYAVVLAYSGEFDPARKIMTDLKPFAHGSPRWRDEFENQERLIGLIETGTVPRIIDRPAKRINLKLRKIGRNEPCPCGSGKKFKRCCGR